ncbi:unnamed protein product [Allacma fusca]|uniref:TLC domain-containing protein n=1 Tax=Allacma fusca TaxID=39272 RepID=A0A8J2P3K0_9HEXA|nr:unnamed protein product [Allacma fusca]
MFPATFILQRYLWNATKLGQTLAKKYSFTDKDVADISNKIVSAFQAVLAAVAGILVCKNCAKDVLRDKHAATLIYAWLGIPYFVYDTVCMFYVDRIAKKIPPQPKYQTFLDFLRFVLRTPVIVIHHIVMAPIGFSLIVWYRDEIMSGDFFVGIIYMMETSTPFVSIRFILSKLKMKSTLAYAVNGVCMLLFFPVFRIASVFYAWALYSDQLKVSYYESFMDAQFVWKVCFIAALAPQIYWYVLMWKGLLRMLKPTSDGPAKKLE